MKAKQKWRFAFIVHPRNLHDIFLMYPILRSFSPDRVRAFLKVMRPFLVSPIVRFGKSEAEEFGWLLANPLTPDLIQEDPDLARQKIQQALEVAQEAGADLVGLGGWNASVSDRGRDLAHSQLAVTSGLAMTVAIILSDIAQILRWKGIPMGEATVAVIGSGGAIGRVVRLNLRAAVKRLISLSAQDKERSCIREADLVIVATRAVEPVVYPHDLKDGAIIYDVSEPSNVPTDLSATRSDVVVIHGGLVKTPGFDYGPFLGLPPETAFACLAETLLLALEQRNGDRQARVISLDNVTAVAEQAQRHGFVSALKLDKY